MCEFYNEREEGVASYLLPVRFRVSRGRGLHTGVVLAAHPKITTHPSVVPRENDSRWKGKPLGHDSHQLSHSCTLHLAMQILT